MNDLDSILKKIDAEAQAYGNNLIDAAKKNAEGIRAQYAEEAKKAEKLILGKAEAEAMEIKQRASSEASIASKNARLSARHLVMEKSFSKALENLGAMDEKSKVSFYAKMIVLNCTDDAELIFNQNDQKLAEKVLNEASKQLKDSKKDSRISLSKQVGNFAGGLIMKCGKIEYNCTFEVLLDSAKESLESDVVSVLFDN